MHVVFIDLVVQAKSGTGKTAVFTIIALDSITLSIHSPQVLINIALVCGLKCSQRLVL